MLGSIALATYVTCTIFINSLSFWPPCHHRNHPELCPQLLAGVVLAAPPTDPVTSGEGDVVVVPPADPVTSGEGDAAVAPAADPAEATGSSGQDLATDIMQDTQQPTATKVNAAQWSSMEEACYLCLDCKRRVYRMCSS